jgi:hypothetical protein
MTCSGSRLALGVSGRVRCNSMPAPVRAARWARLEPAQPRRRRSACAPAVPDRPALQQIVGRHPSDGDAEARERGAGAFEAGHGTVLALAGKGLAGGAALGVLDADKPRFPPVPRSRLRRSPVIRWPMPSIRPGFSMSMRIGSPGRACCRRITAGSGVERPGTCGAGDPIPGSAAPPGRVGSCRQGDPVVRPWSRA